MAIELWLAVGWDAGHPRLLDRRWNINLNCDCNSATVARLANYNELSPRTITTGKLTRRITLRESESLLLMKLMTEIIGICVQYGCVSTLENQTADGYSHPTSSV